MNLARDEPSSSYVFTLNKKKMILSACCFISATNAGNPPFADVTT